MRIPTFDCWKKDGLLEVAFDEFCFFFFNRKEGRKRMEEMAKEEEEDEEQEERYDEGIDYQDE